MITSSRTNVDKPEFPYLASTGRTVILISGRTRDRELIGMVVHSFHGSTFQVGYYSTSWNADELKRCDDTVTIFNA